MNGLNMEQTVGDVGGDFTKTVIVESAGPEGDVQAGIEFIYHMREHIVDVGIATIYLLSVYAIYLWLKKTIK